ncbi:MAG: (2Fe-2S)-binding protein [Methylocystis sp.]|nr:(2Fe-2S)-binding protein [Methylocystis sp.]
MIVCSCNVVSDDDVRDCLGAETERVSVGAVFRTMGHEPKCGRCARNISGIVDEHVAVARCSGNGDCDNCQADQLAA